MKKQKYTTIAKHELKIIIRSKWLTSFGVLFTLLAVTIVMFGGSSEQAGFEGFNRMTASLLNVSLFLLPLLTLLIGSTSLAGDKEDGGLALLVTYPIAARHIILGRYLGLFVALFAVISLGYGIAGVSLFFYGNGVSASFYLLFYFMSLLLTLIFLSVSMLVGVFSLTRFQALGSSLFLWAFFVLFYEFIVMGIVLVTPKNFVLTIFTISTLLNPVELIRVWTIIGLDSASIFGPNVYHLTVWSAGVLGQLAFLASSLLWMILPVGMAITFVKRGFRHG